MAKIGSKSSVILLLFITSVVILGFLFWSNQHSNLQQQEALQAKQHQLSSSIQLRFEEQVVAWQQQLTDLAKRPSVAEAIVSRIPSLMATQQQALKEIFPEAQQVCLLAASIDKRDPNACVPISFAELSSIREAKEKGSATVALMQLDSPEPYVLLAHAITTDNNDLIGVLIITLAKEVLTPLIPNVSDQALYFELRQGKGSSAKLFSAGNSELRQNGTASLTKSIANSHWKLKSWTITHSPELPVQIIIIGAISLVLLILLIVPLLQRTSVKKGTKKSKQPHSQSEFHEIELKISHQVSSKQAQRPQQGETHAEPPQNQKTSEIVEETRLKSIEEKIEQEVELSPSIFKAYDIRGIVGKTLSVQIIRTLGQAVGSLALDQGCSGLVVGRDGRLSSKSLSEALMGGILSTGCDVIDIGQVPTPIVYFASRHLGTQSGVMLTASHNPADHNGLKTHINGKSISGANLQKLYQRIIDDNLQTGTGKKTTADVAEDYITQISQNVKLANSPSIVIDCGNGVAGPIASKLFTALGCDVTELYCEVDGNFPNHHPNPSEPDNLKDLITTVKSQGAALGLAFDGDGDRLGVIDAKGQILWPDRLMMLFAKDILSRSPGSTIIYDVKSTRLLEDEIQAADGKALMWKSGYSNIKEKMEELDAPLAGEMTGHIIFKDRWFGVDDALYSACRLLELLACDPIERTSDEVFASLPNCHNTPEIFIDLAEGESQRFMCQLEAEARFTNAKVTNIDGLRIDYPFGWGLVRASNTVSGLTLRFEADTLDNLHHIQQQFKQQMLQVKPTLALHF